jgi:hypothetical protein
MDDPESDPERIWLEPKSCVDEAEGRQWCEDNVWTIDDDGAQGVEYVRADLASPTPTNDGEGLIERLTKYCDEYEDAPNWGGPTMYPKPPSVKDLRALLAALNQGAGQ